MHLRHSAWREMWAPRLLLWLRNAPTSKAKRAPSPAPGTYLGSQLLLFLGGKLRAAVWRDIHPGHDLPDPLLQGRTLLGGQEPLQHQEPILLELQVGGRLRLPAACSQTLSVRTGRPRPPNHVKAR